MSRGLSASPFSRLIGFHAEQPRDHHWGRRLLHAGLSAGLGLVVVGVELLVYH